MTDSKIKTFFIILFRIISIILGLILIKGSVQLLPTLNKNIGNYIPIFAGIYLVLQGLLFSLILKFTSSGFLYIIRSIWFAGIFFIFITFIFIFISIQYFANITPQKNHDAIIILGAGLRGKQISSTLRDRLDKAIEYFNDNPNAVIVVAGGQGADEIISEAEAMKTYLLSQNIPEHKILEENKSTSTEENFDFSKKILDAYFNRDDYTIVFVTNDFHSLRASFYAKDIGLNAQGYPCSSWSYMYANYYSREYLAIMWYFVKKLFAFLF